MSDHDQLIDFARHCMENDSKSSLFVQDNRVYVKASFGTVEILSAGQLSEANFTYKSVNFPVPVNWKTRFNTNFGEVFGCITAVGAKIIYSFEACGVIETAFEPSTSLSAFEEKPRKRKSEWLALSWTSR